MERYKIKTPETAGNQFDKIMDFINLIACPVGLELTQDWQMSYRGVNGLIVSLFYLSWSFYSFYALFPSIVGMTITAGVLLQSAILIKFGSIWCKQKKFYVLMQFLSTVYNSNTSGPKVLILLGTTKKMYQHFKLAFAGIIFGFIVYAFYPFYDFVFNGNLTKVSPLILPSLDESTLSGYSILLVLNILPLTWHVFGVVAASCVFFIHVDGYEGLVDVVEEDFKSFDEMCKNRKGDAKQRELAFRNIMMEITDIARFSENINELYTLVATVQIGAFYMATVVVLFAYMAINYISGIGAAAYFMTELLLFCYIGQLMDNSTKRLEEIIYNAAWYTYEIKYQRDMMFALSVIQGVKPIVVGGILQLNFETGLKVVKCIYSMTMFFAGVVE